MTKPDSATPAETGDAACRDRAGRPFGAPATRATLKNGQRQPIFIPHHMPSRFTTSRAKRLGRRGGRGSEAVDSKTVLNGRFYFAARDWHMTTAKIHLTRAPPVNVGRPDPA